jgi:hypothetical protein
MGDEIEKNAVGLQGGVLETFEKLGWYWLISPVDRSIDPDKDRKKEYDVENASGRSAELKVMGYEGIKLLSETTMWTRAPVDLKKRGYGVMKRREAKCKSIAQTFPRHRSQR